MLLGSSVVSNWPPDAVWMKMSWPAANVTPPAPNESGLLHLSAAEIPIAVLVGLAPVHDCWVATHSTAPVNVCAPELVLVVVPENGSQSVVGKAAAVKV